MLVSTRVHHQQKRVHPLQAQGKLSASAQPGAAAATAAATAVATAINIPPVPGTAEAEGTVNETPLLGAVEVGGTAHETAKKHPISERRKGPGDRARHHAPGRCRGRALVCRPELLRGGYRDHQYTRQVGRCLQRMRHSGESLLVRRDFSMFAQRYRRAGCVVERFQSIGCVGGN